MRVAVSAAPRPDFEHLRSEIKELYYKKLRDLRRRPFGTKRDEVARYRAAFKAAVREVVSEHFPRLPEWELRRWCADVQAFMSRRRTTSPVPVQQRQEFRLAVDLLGNHVEELWRAWLDSRGHPNGRREQRDRFNKVVDHVLDRSELPAGRATTHKAVVAEVQARARKRAEDKARRAKEEA